MPQLTNFFSPPYDVDKAHTIRQKISTLPAAWKAIWPPCANEGWTGYQLIPEIWSRCISLPSFLLKRIFFAENEEKRMSGYKILENANSTGSISRPSSQQCKTMCWKIQGASWPSPWNDSNRIHQYGQCYNHIEYAEETHLNRQKD